MNEDQEKNEDLAISDKGAITSDEGTNIEVKIGGTAEPVINDIEVPPPDAGDAQSTEAELNNDSGTESEVKIERINQNSDTEALESSTELETENNESTDEQQANDPPITSSVTSDGVSHNQVSSVSKNEQSLPHSEHRNNKKLAVLITVIVAVMLAGAAIYVYISAQDNTAETPSQSQESLEDSNNKDVTPASSEDVDETLTQIDQSLDEIDSETNTNLNEEAVSDQNLGL